MHSNDIWPRGYKTVFMHNSTEHEISTAHIAKMQKNNDISCLKHSDIVLILFRNVKMPTIVGILTFMSWKKSCSVELSMKKAL